MKSLMERLASGNAVYETPDALISENRISVELESGSSMQGEITIQGQNGKSVKGVVFSTDSHIVFENNQFNGIHNTVKYTALSKNLLNGQICSGTISVVTTAGDYAIPFAITVKERKIQTTMGTLSDLKDFVKLVQQSYDEALILFLSKEFQDYFLGENLYALSLYRQVMKNTNRNIALEEFLVGMKLKERVSIAITDKIHEYTDITENYGGVLNISRSSWGYVDIDVSVQGDFLYHCKEKISGEEFNGKIAEYQYFINAGKLHGGSNCGRIILKTSNETITFDIVIVNQKNKIEEYINEKKSDVRLVKNYLDFRTGKIDGTTWLDTMSGIAKERLAHNKNDGVGLLAKAQVSILQKNTELANQYLSEVSQIVAVKKSNSIVQYCYYLYLKSLYKNNAAYTDEVKNEIREYFEGGFDRWQLLWLLFYMDERYDDNPTLKYTMVKRMFHNGCTSPIMYYEAANVLNQQPELLRILNKFELQVLNFAGRYHMVSRNLARQTAELISKERTVSDTHIRILSQIYQDIQDDDVLGCICAQIIHGNRKEREYFHWLEEGVKKELKITNLYEYYIYTINTEDYPLLEKAAYKYFSYGTDTLAYGRDYFYANLIKNFNDTDEIYEKCREGMEKYALEQLRQGNNNIHLRKIYSKLLSDSFIVGNIESKMPDILHTYRITLKNRNIQNVIVSHKEINDIQCETVENGSAYIQMYTENPVIVFTDYQGRILADSEYQLTEMTIDCPITKKGTNFMMDLCQMEKIMKDPEQYQGRIAELKKVSESSMLTDRFRCLLQKFMVDYYYKGYDQGDLDLYILQIPMAELTKESRNKVIEILIQRNLISMAYPYIVKYGYNNISGVYLEKLCLELVESGEYEDNEILIEMCANLFRNGCRKKAILKYLGKYYATGTLEMYQLFLAACAKEIEDNTLAERLLVQLIFEANTEDKLYHIYREYLKGPTSTVIRKAFYTYVTYNSFIKKVQHKDDIWEFLEQEYANGLNTPLICKITFLEEMSKREELSQQQIKISQMLLEDLAKKHVNLEFYKKFYRWFKIPFQLIDKTIIDFRTNPKHRVDITYSIKTAEGSTKQVTEEMGSIYQGIFTKEIIMFYGEEINYSITEYSDEFPQGKIVDNYSVKITEKNIYNDESRFGMINGMMICKDLGREDGAKDIMLTYQLCKDAGKKVFKLL